MLLPWPWVGDLIKNIAEEIIFYTNAEVLKHKKKK